MHKLFIPGVEYEEAGITFRDKPGRLLFFTTAKERDHFRRNFVGSFPIKSSNWIRVSGVGMHVKDYEKLLKEIVNAKDNFCSSSKDSGQKEKV